MDIKLESFDNKMNISVENRATAENIFRINVTKNDNESFFEVANLKTISDLEAEVIAYDPELNFLNLTFNYYGNLRQLQLSLWLEKELFSWKFIYRSKWW